jgi:hypothetical protein
MSTSISLTGNQELQFVPDNFEKTIKVYLFDTLSDTRVTLTEFIGGKWTSKSDAHLDKFFELVKANPKIRVRLKKVFSEMREESTTGNFMTTFKCAKRRFIIQVKKILK